MKFFERFRQALRRYVEGVHVLGPPATEEALRSLEARLGRPLPQGYRDLLFQWNGATLFLEAVCLYGAPGCDPPLDRLATVVDLIEIGEADGARLRLDPAGRVVAFDQETERLTVVGSSIERWLDAIMAREGVLYDREGEFRGEAFDGGELSPRAARRRAEAGIRADPDAPAWHQELGLLLLDAGRTDEAARSLERAAALDPGAYEAHFALGKLRRAAGDLAGAAEAFRAAGRADGPPEEAAFAFAHAARALRAAGRAGEAEAAGAQAVAAHPPFVAEQKTAAAHLLEEKAGDDAIERLELAQAVAADDPELARLAGLARARRALTTID